MSKHEPVAIVGVAALFPGSQDAAGFWRDIVAGRDLIGDVPPNYWLVEDYYDPDPSAPDKTYGKRGAFLTPVPFDALEFGLPPTALPATDSAQLLALIGAKRVLADAACGREQHVSRERVSIYLGVAATTANAMNMAARLHRPAWVKGLRESGLPESLVQAACDRIAANFTPLQENTFPGILGNVVAGRIANRFDLGGTNFTLDAACASSLAAVSVALNDLYLGNSDMVITGGVDALNDIQMFMCFSKTPALSPSGDCRPFSDKADGTMLGEGLSLFALRRLSDAERDGDRIYAVIRGLGSSSDGRAKSVYAPRPQGQATALRRAYESAGYSPETVELMEAHGTATPAGDLAEFEGMRTVFAETGKSGGQWCALGSVKSQLGHTKGAAGAAGLFKVAMALHHKVLPPTIKVEQPNPALDINNSPFYLNTEARPWISRGTNPRRGSVSSFGFGGTNFHVTLEEYKGPALRPASLVQSPAEVFLIATETGDNLLAECKQLAGSFADDLDWRRKARESQKSFDRNRPCRAAIVAVTEDDLRKKLSQLEQKLQNGAERVWDLSGIYVSRRTEAPAISFLFSGQGSQYVGMGKQLAMTFDSACEAWDLAQETLATKELSLRDVVFPKPAFNDAEREAQSAFLTRTENAQPALAAAALAHLAVMKAVGITPQWVAGHSFGELVALHAAGVITVEDLLCVASERGRLMAAAAQVPGTMTAVSCDAEKLQVYLTKWDSHIVVANHNSPLQSVLSGSVEAMEDVERRLAESKVAFRRLPVAAAFHSPLVANSVAPFADFLGTIPFSTPAIPVISNSDATAYPTEPECIRKKLGDHLGQPVLFAEQIEKLYECGVRCFVELGAGAVLTGLVAQCLQGREHVAVALDRKGADGTVSLLHALAQLAVERVAVNLEALWSSFAPIGEAQPPHKRGSTFLIDGAGYGRPYPPRGGAAALPKPNPEVDFPAIPAGATARLTASEARSDSPSAEALPLASPSLNSGQPAGAKTTVPVPTAQSSQSVAVYHEPATTEWLEAFRDIQQQITAAQKATQAAILETHSLTLKSLESLSQSLPPDARIKRSEVAGVARTLPLQETETASAEVPLLAARTLSAPKQSHATLQYERALPQVMAPAPVHHAALQAVAAAPGSKPAAAVAGIGSDATVDIQRLLLEVVSEKTGYPVDVLSLDTELEAGLGIDSIKRVEIFSAVQQRATHLPEVRPQDMASLRTLREIMSFLDPNPRAAASHAPSVALPSRPNAAAIEHLLLEVVAEKTGYPAEVLNLDTELESGLGIDSIKRVEIFSAIQQRANDLPEVNPQDMASLRTLREIIAFLNGPALSAREIPATASLVSGAPTSMPAQRSITPVAQQNIQDLLLEVVAEKTGYPAEALGLDVELEAGLGIDSIKRVEIFSAIQQRAGSLPEVRPQDMSSLRTLREILAFLERDSRAETASLTSATVSLANSAAASAGSASVPLAASGSEFSRVQAAVAHGNGDAKIVTLLREYVRTTPAVAPGLPIPGLFACKSLAVTDDGSGVAAALVGELKRKGVAARLVKHVTAEDDSVIYLGALRRFAGIDDAVHAQFDAFTALKTVSSRADRTVLFVSVQSTGGDFGLSGRDEFACWSAGLSGLVKTASQEFPESCCKTIDLERADDSPQRLASRLIAELLNGGAQNEIGLKADGSRVAIAVAAAPLLPAEVRTTPHSRITSDSVLLVSGGARGVTAACLVALAKSAHPKIAMLGRTVLEEETPQCSSAPDDAALKRVLTQQAKSEGKIIDLAAISRSAAHILAMREIRSTLTALQDAGSEVIYLSANIEDAAGVAASAEVVRRRFGSITGVIHAAGVLADKRIADKSDKQFEAVFNTKVLGLKSLLEATASDPLNVLCVFSSVAARYGNSGQCDYSAANEVLNKVAAFESRRRGSACLVKSINWGPWEGGMVTPALAEHFRSHNVGLIPLAEGAAIFVEELCRPVDRSAEVLLSAPSSATQPRQPFAAASRAQRAVEILVNSQTYPILDGHRIQRDPAIPVVLAMEWFHRFADTWRPDVEVKRCKDLRVLRGVLLPRYDNGGHLLQVHTRQIPNGASPTLYCELRSRDNTVHYSATMEMQPRRHSPPTKTLSGEAKSFRPAEEVLRFYEGALFHGPDFQVIHSVEKLDADGATATLASTRKMGWKSGPWRTEAAAIDGALQVLRLWGIEHLGSPSLPTRVGACLHHAAPTDGLLTCVARCKAVGKFRTVSDVSLYDMDGRAVAELRDVEMHVVPEAQSLA